MRRRCHSLHSGGPSASLGATSEPADRRFSRAAPAGPAVSSAALAPPGDLGGIPPSFRGCRRRPLVRAPGPCFRRAFGLRSTVLRAPLVPRCAAAGEVSPDPSRPRPDAPFARTRQPHPRRPRTPANPSAKAGFPGARNTAYDHDGGVFWGVPVPPKPGGTLRAGLRAPCSGHRASGSHPGGSLDSHARLPASRAVFAGLPTCGSLAAARHQLPHEACPVAHTHGACFARHADSGTGLPHGVAGR